MGAPKGNKYSPGLEPKYKDEESLQKKIDDYFNHCGEKATISGLAYHLGFVSRQSIYDYENKNQSKSLSYIMKRAVLKIENAHEEGMFNQSNAGHIFWLKNRGWTDTQNINQKSEITITDQTELGLP